jgi:hypothetical protein
MAGAGIYEFGGRATCTVRFGDEKRLQQYLISNFRSFPCEGPISLQHGNSSSIGATKILE